jgi:hypothetical protein
MKFGLPVSTGGFFNVYLTMIFKQAQNPLPTQGATRTTIKFAWWPICCADCKVWLENYEILEAWIDTEYNIFLDGQWQMVLVGEWVEISKRQIRWKRI